MTSPEFSQAWRAARNVEGWLTEGQGRRLWHAVSRVPPGGRVVEIGSFRGRSTLLLASAARVGVEVVAIDPHRGSDRGPGEIAGDPRLGDRDHERFHANLADAGVADRVRHVRRFSAEATAEVRGAIDTLFVDGAHRFAPARDDLRSWGERVRPGGTMLVHDAFSSVGVTLALFATVIARRRWRFVGRERSLAVYVRGGGSPARELLLGLGQLPWFLRNLAIKVVLSTPLRHVARRAGRSWEWPY